MFDNLLSSLGSFIPNKKSLLTVLAKYLEDHVKHPVKDYDLIFKNNEKKLDFKVYIPENLPLPKGYDPDTRSRVYFFDDEMFKKAISETVPKIVDEKLSKGTSLDVAILEYRNNGETAVIHAGSTNEKGEKIKTTFAL